MKEQPDQENRNKRLIEKAKLMSHRNEQLYKISEALKEHHFELKKVIDDFHKIVTKSLRE